METATDALTVSPYVAEAQKRAATQSTRGLFYRLGGGHPVYVNIWQQWDYQGKQIQDAHQFFFGEHARMLAYEDAREESYATNIGGIMRYQETVRLNADLTVECVDVL